jgi:competence protein ComEA
VSGLVGAVGGVGLVLAIGTATGVDDPATTSGSDPGGVGLLAAAAAGAQPGSAALSVETIVVDVSGGVLEPGLRTLEAGDRVGDAIAAAGGFAPRADLTETSRTINLAQPLSDGMKILVPELGAETGPTDQGADEGDQGLDLNDASQQELETLPGIGPVTALRIIEAREEQPFGTVDDLRDRGVVGQSVFEDIRDLVHADGG